MFTKRGAPDTAATSKTNSPIYFCIAFLINCEDLKKPEQDQFSSKYEVLNIFL